MYRLPGGSVVKNLAIKAGDTRSVHSIPGLGRSLEEETATHSSILVWRIPRTEEPGGSIGSQRVGHDWPSKTERGDCILAFPLQLRRKRKKEGRERGREGGRKKERKERERGRERESTPAKGRSIQRWSIVKGLLQVQDLQGPWKEGR